MKLSLHTGYVSRLLLVTVLGAGLCMVLFGRKVRPSWHAWRQSEQLALSDPFAERRDLEVELRRLDERSAVQGAGWEPVLSYLTSGSGSAGTALAAVDPEHTWPMSGMTLHILPIRLTGRTDALLNIIASVDPKLHGTTVASLDMHVRRTGHQGPRTLTATLYLRSLRR